MGIKEELIKITDVIWEIPVSYRSDMKVPARIFATKEMIENILDDRSLYQLVNVSTLPGIQKNAIVMPDVHEGYGFPIGGVAATSYPDGVISPGGIGYDINCGVRLLKSNLEYKVAGKFIDKLTNEIYNNVPSGVGKSGSITLGSKDLNNLLRDGVKWTLNEGFAENEDLNYIESNGTIKNADPNKVSSDAKKRGSDQLGTMGAGNHFVEIDRVAEIYDDDSANAFGLFKNQIVILIHTGSRGLGHQVASDYIKIMLHSMKDYNIVVPDRELACSPMNSQEGSDYFNAMCAAANFAFSNRQIITHQIRKAWEKVFNKSGTDLQLLYDVAHNIAKIEEHVIKGKKRKLIVHRKGATRAFGPDNSEIPEKYRKIGQPVIIPGSMGTASYVLTGTIKSSEETFGSTCHGAGRQMSRHAARKKVNPETLRRELLSEGIQIQTGSMRGLAEEAPIAYKDIHSVIDVVVKAGIANKVARLRPIAVIKG
jgi:tRNA-splicing ligase RtcB (3'-phosphate/5'-hydroxy nucleic acid ligase)